VRAIISLLFVSVIGLTLSSCASSSGQAVNLNESRRVVGTDNDVRVDAEVWGDRLASSLAVPIKYDITNLRSGSIAIAELMPTTSYDPDTQTVMVSIGSEVPGEQFLPRLIVIGPGEKKSFAGVAHVNILMPGMSPLIHYPNALQIKVNFLNDPKPFERLIAIPERAVHDPQLANELFPKWIDRNEVVLTNALPMKWRPDDTGPAPSSRGRRARP
jgi:hypothetical protein